MAFATRWTDKRYGDDMILSSILLAAVIITGPIPADVVRVLDGDTVEVTAHLFPDLMIQTEIRVLGVDTPEKAPRAKCTEEAELAKKASKYVNELLVKGTRVRLENVKHDKYGGRYVANLNLSGIQLSQLLIQAGYARPYDGGTKSSWCK